MAHGFRRVRRNLVKQTLNGGTLVKSIQTGSILAALIVIIWAGTTDRRPDVTQIRTVSGELVEMQLLDTHVQYLLTSEYQTPEEIFDGWFRPGEFISEKSVYPKVHELLLYNHIFGVPEIATPQYTYLVANAALSNTNFYFDTDEERSERHKQNRSILDTIVRAAQGGDKSARWAVSKVEEVRLEGKSLKESIEQ